LFPDHELICIWANPVPESVRCGEKARPAIDDGTPTSAMLNCVSLPPMPPGRSPRRFEDQYV
jgi:hypothetical protein